MADKKEIKIDFSDAEKDNDDRNDAAEAEVRETEESGAGPEMIPEAEEPQTEEDALKAKVAELEDRLLRTMADFDNFKKRSARQYEDIIASANDRLLTELLDIVDNFERALEHADNNRGSSADGLAEGTKLIYNQIRDLLARYNVTPIEAVGKTFDPNFHDAMMQVDSDEYEEGIVAVEISKGYRRGERVLRHSKVGVSRGPAAME
jgi:molecular chaperone GrpE